MASSKPLDLGMFEQEVSCSICMEVYNHEEHLPKLLQCGHTFCMVCIIQYVDQRLGMDFCCPICKTKINLTMKGVNSLPTVFAVLSLCDRIAQNEHLSPGAGAVSRASRVTKERKCRPHSRDSEHVCLTCKEVLCSKCVFAMATSGEHAGHQVIDIQEGLKQTKGKAEQWTQELSDARSCFEDKAQEAMQSLEKVARDTEWKINKNADACIKKVNDWRETSTKELADAFKSAEKKIRAEAQTFQNEEHITKERIKNFKSMQDSENINACFMSSDVDREQRELQRRMYSANFLVPQITFTKGCTVSQGHLDIKEVHAQPQQTHSKESRRTQNSTCRSKVGRTPSSAYSSGRPESPKYAYAQVASTQVQQETWFIRTYHGPKKYLKAILDDESTTPRHWRKFQGLFKGAKEFISSSDDERSYLVRFDTKVRNEVEQMMLCTWKQNLVGHGRDGVGIAASRIQIIDVQRVENPRVYRDYHAQRKLFCQEGLQRDFQQLTKGGEPDVMTSTLGLAAIDATRVQEINEYFLFYGVKQDKLKHVVLQGMDSRLGSNAYFGRGVYLFESSTKADQYSDTKFARHPNGTELVMIIARALLGNTWHQKGACNDNTRPPCMVAGCHKVDCYHPQRFHSVMGTHSNPSTPLNFREFVLHDSNRVYPEYVVRYKRL